MIDVKQILRDKPGSFTSYFIPLLVLSEDNNKLIDVLELFGLDKLETAIERLGGSTVTFPTWNTIDTLIQDAYLLSCFDTLIETVNSRKVLEEDFGAPFNSLKARAKALRTSLYKPITIGEFPGAKESKKWIKSLKSVTDEIKECQMKNP